MENFQNENLPIIVVIGEMKDDRAVFGNSFDPSYTLTDGQFRALYMKLQRTVNSNKFEFEKTYILDNGKALYIATSPKVENRILYCVLHNEGKFSERLIENIKTVANRGGIYTAKRFYLEVSELQVSVSQQSDIDQLSFEEAISLLKNKVVLASNFEEIATIIIRISRNGDIISQNVLQKIIDALKVIPKDYDADLFLDSCYVIGLKYEKLLNYNEAHEIFVELSYAAEKFDRLALMISARLRSANLARMMNKDPTYILDLLSNIDDGSLEVASQDEREMYYSLHGSCMEMLGDEESAEEFHQMTVFISEVETSPSIYVAESRAYLGYRASKKYQPDIATREFLTAATIAQLNNELSLRLEYSHQAALQELFWSKLLVSAAIVSYQNSDRTTAEYYSWQGLKRLINSVMHSDRARIKEDIFDKAIEVIDMTKSVLRSINSEYGIQISNELENQFRLLVNGQISHDQETELLNFMYTKISSMLPLPPPIIMLIANDGRLILGGEIGQEDWNETIMENDDLFSGALSAIMAILSEVISDKSPLRMLDTGQTQIMIEKSRVCIGALLVDRDLIIIRKALKRVVEYMEENYPGLSDWDGYSLDFSDVKPKIEEIFKEAFSHIIE